MGDGSSKGEKMSRSLRILLLILTFSLSSSPFFSQAENLSETKATGLGFPQQEVVTYESDGLTLKAYLYKHQEKGPFPAYIWNHGSEKNPSDGRKLARFWTDHGFVFFAPIRSGHGDNPGDYIGDEQKEVRAMFGGRKRLAFQQVTKLHDRANDDVVAAFRWLKTQSVVDPKRIVVAGGSVCGIQTVCAAGREARLILVCD